jgi:hypothetical protein
MHTLGIFRMAQMFVGPLLKLADQEGGGWHLFGPSSDIKSLLDLLAMMVWGRGVRGGGFGRKWRGTANGAEGVAGAHNDTALCLDDTSNALAPEIATIVYMLVAEEAKLRMNADTSMRETPPHRANVLSSGEKDLPEILRAAKLVVPGGLVVRLPGIAAIGRGRSAGEPGAALDVSPSSVRSYIRRLCACCGGAATAWRGRCSCAISSKRRSPAITSGNLVEAFVKLPPANWRLSLALCRGQRGRRSTRPNMY